MEESIDTIPLWPLIYNLGSDETIEAPEALIVDTCALVREEPRRRLELLVAKGTILHITKEVKHEVVSCQNRRKDSFVSDEEAERAKELMREIENEGGIIDECRFHDNYRLLDLLDPALSKRVLDNLVLANFETLYQHLQGYVPTREKGIHPGSGSKSFIEAILYEKRFADKVYGLITRMSEALPEEVDEAYIALATNGVIDYYDCVDRIKAVRPNGSVEIFSYFNKLFRIMYTEIRRDSTYESIKDACERRCMRTGKTDRNLVLASMGTGYPIVTLDPDVEDLTVLVQSNIFTGSLQYSA